MVDNEKEKSILRETLVRKLNTNIRIVGILVFTNVRDLMAEEG